VCYSKLCVLAFCICIFRWKEMGNKGVQQMLVSLTPGLNFINFLRTAFMLADPECAKKTVKLAVSFGAFGTYERKSCTWWNWHLELCHVIFLDQNCPHPLDTWHFKFIEWECFETLLKYDVLNPITNQWFSTFLAHTNIKKHLYLEVFKTQKIYDLQTKSSNFPQSID